MEPTSHTYPTWLPPISVWPFFRRTAAHAEGAATDHANVPELRVNAVRAGDREDDFPLDSVARFANREQPRRISVLHDRRLVRTDWIGRVNLGALRRVVVPNDPFVRGDLAGPVLAREDDISVGEHAAIAQLSRTRVGARPRCLPIAHDIHDLPLHAAALPFAAIQERVLRASVLSRLIVDNIKVCDVGWPG